MGRKRTVSPAPIERPLSVFSRSKPASPLPPRSCQTAVRPHPAIQTTVGNWAQMPSEQRVFREKILRCRSYVYHSVYEASSKPVPAGGRKCGGEPAQSCRAIRSNKARCSSYGVGGCSDWRIRQYDRWSCPKRSLARLRDRINGHSFWRRSCRCLSDRQILAISPVCLMLFDVFRLSSMAPGPGGRRSLTRSAAKDQRHARARAAAYDRHIAVAYVPRSLCRIIGSLGVGSDSPIGRRDPIAMH